MLLRLLIVVLLSPMPALADKPIDLHILGGAMLGYSSYDFPQKLDHKLTLPVYQFSAAASYRRYYLALNVSDSIGDTQVSEEEDLGQASRYDYDISAGYQLTKQWGVFAGYKLGQTDIEFEERELLIKRDEFYKQAGLFVGATYSHKFETAGKLSFTLAYADLNATNNFKEDIEPVPDEGEAPEFDDLTGKARGTTKGFSYGIKWTIPIGGQLLYYASYKVNDYQQALKADGVSYSNIDEKIGNFSMGVSHVW